MRPHSFEPISTARRRPLLSFGNILLFTFIAGFGLYANGHLPELDHFFDHAQAFGRTHNDTVVHTVLYFLPAALVVGAITVLATLRLTARRNGQRNGQRNTRQNGEKVRAAAIQEKPALDPALATAPPVSREQAEILPQQAEPAPEAELLILPVRMPTEPGSTLDDGPKPVLVVRNSADTVNAPNSPAEEGSVLAAKATTTALAASSPHAEADQDLGDDLPTLPLRPRVRRPVPHRTLSPAVAAALELQVAASSTSL